MPVYMITLHAYRSWSADNPDGYFQRGEHGVKPPDPTLARKRASLAKHPARHFAATHQRFIVEQSQEIISNRDIRLHAISCTGSHTHFVVSWLGHEALFNSIDDPSEQACVLANKVKTVLATLLSKQSGTTGNRWFSRGCNCTPVEDPEHLNHLIENYLPKHHLEGGIVRVFDRGNSSP